MTTDIAIVFSILGVAVVLFITEWLRMDLVALMVLTSLALTGLVTPDEAFSGFSNPAVITFWAVFILSGGLSRTGVATILGSQILRLAGNGQLRLMIVIMLTAALLSGFMNNVGSVALLLPVVMDVARRTSQPPSKLLMPLAFASLLGGLTTLIGTPTNILISDALSAEGLPPFQMFDYTPTGILVTLSGITFIALIGRYLLPTRDLAREYQMGEQTNMDDVYDFKERMFVVHLPYGCALQGTTLADSRLGSVLGLNVVGIVRNGAIRLAPSADEVLKENDRLLATGRRDKLDELSSGPQFIIDEEVIAVERLASADLAAAEMRVSADSLLVGRSLLESKFRQRFGVVVLAMMRNGLPRRTHLHHIPLQSDDTLLLQGPLEQLQALRQSPDVSYFSIVSEARVDKVYRLHERIIALRIPSDSPLVGKTLIESHLGDGLRLTVLNIVREDGTHLMPSPDEQLQADDLLLVTGQASDLQTVRGLQDLHIDSTKPAGLSALETEKVGLAEAILSPHTTLSSKTLRELNFRDKYGLSVLAIWREGRAYRSNLRDMVLRLGDALLLFGQRKNLRELDSEPDFLVLTAGAQEPPLVGKAPLAVLVMVGVLLPVILGWVTIAVSAVAGAVVMVMTGSLTMDEAYRFINWRGVFLIAGMLPLGIALDNTGAARLIADDVVSLVGDTGPLAVMAAFFILAALASQVMPNPAVAVLLAPVALSSAAALGISPFPLMMTVSLSASAAFLSPVGHPVNLMVMGPGGYRFSDYARVGLLLMLVVFGVTLLIVPVLWPFNP